MFFRNQWETCEMKPNEIFSGKKCFKCLFFMRSGICNTLMGSLFGVVILFLILLITYCHRRRQIREFKRYLVKVKFLQFYIKILNTQYLREVSQRQCRRTFRQDALRTSKMEITIKDQSSKLSKSKIIRNRLAGPFFNPKAVGMDSGVQFSLSNFLEDILQPTTSKMSPTSNLGL